MAINHISEALKGTFYVGKMPGIHPLSFLMKQMTFTDAKYADKRKQNSEELSPSRKYLVVPWKGLVALIDPQYSKRGGLRAAQPLMTILLVQLMQNWFSYSDSAM